MASSGGGCQIQIAERFLMQNWLSAVPSSLAWDSCSTICLNSVFELFWPCATPHGPVTRSAIPITAADTSARGRVSPPVLRIR